MSGKKKSEGLGDTIEKVLKPVQKILKKVLPKDCGCKARKTYLNDLVNYKRKAVRCLDDKDIESYKKYRSRRQINKWELEDIQLIIDLYAKVFAIQYKMSDLCDNCKDSGQKRIYISNSLDTVYESYI